jgi:hypothetical protein
MEKLLKYRMTAPPDIFDIPGQPPEEAYVFMYAEHAADDSLIQFEGPDRLVKELKDRVLRSYGFRARLIDEYTAPRDLANAMCGRLLSQYNPEMIEGKEFFAEQEENA